MATGGQNASCYRSCYFKIHFQILFTYTHTCMHKQTYIEWGGKLYPNPNRMNLPLSDMIWSPTTIQYFLNCWGIQILITTVVPYLQLFSGREGEEEVSTAWWQMRRTTVEKGEGFILFLCVRRAEFPYVTLAFHSITTSLLQNFWKIFCFCFIYQLYWGGRIRK